MYVDWEGFGEEVGEIVSAGNKGDNIVVLFDPTFDPVESHVYGLTLFGAY